VRYCVRIARGDDAAHLRLPTFPLLALAEWRATRRCEILLPRIADANFVTWIGG
jgi:hypothetical protein